MTSPKKHASQERPLNEAGARIKRYWLENRPKDTEELRRAGTLGDFLQDQQERFHERKEQLERLNLPPGGAEELLAEEFFPPSEEEMPVLGEDPEVSKVECRRAR